MTNQNALTAIHRAALNLVTEAWRCGVVVTIETTPHQPLAMGNYDMSVSVREARRVPPFAADYSARLGTELLGVAATAQAQAKRIIQGNGAPSDLAQDRRDLPDTLSVLQHALQHGLASLTEPSSLDYARELQALRKKVATYEARDALGLVPPPAGELGPDGKEWAKTAAGYDHVQAMLPRADGEARGPFWYGWALRGAFVAGAEWQEARNPQTPTATYLPLTAAEARDLTCMLAGAPWPDEMLPELQRLLGIYDSLRARNQRPVDPATLPRKVAKEVMKTGLLPNTMPPAAAQEPVKRVFIVATGEEHEGEATYTRHDDAPPPLCDSECLYAAPQPAPTAETVDALKLLAEVAACFTRDDDLPDGLLTRIDAALASYRAKAA